MKGQQFILGLASCLLATTMAGAAEADRVAAAIDNLGHARFQVRQQAALELISSGESALKPLQAALASRDEEVRHRAEAIVRIIENKMRNDALIRAPKLRLKYDNMPLDQALADLSQKSGLPLILDPKAVKNPKQPVTLDSGDVPYWEAIEKFLAAAGIAEVVEAPKPPQPENMYGRNVRWSVPRSGQAPAPDKRIHLIETKSALPASTDTILRIKVLPKEAAGSGITKGSNEINFLLDVTPAPSLAWRGCLSVDVRKAIDERGVNLAQSYIRGTGTAEQAMANGGIWMQNGMMFQQQVIINGNAQIFFDDGSMPAANFGNPRHVPVTLLGKESGSKVLKELHGVITAQVLTAPQPILTIDNIHKATSKDKVENGEYRLQMSEKSMDKAGYVQLRFQLEMPVHNNNLGIVQPFGWPNDLQGSEQPTITFQDSNGKPIKNVSLNIFEQSFNGTTQSSQYVAVVPAQGKEGELVKLVLMGRQTVSIEVPFILKNVPLP